jgi:hypothetical protein
MVSVLDILLLLPPILLPCLLPLPRLLVPLVLCKPVTLPVRLTLLGLDLPLARANVVGRRTAVTPANGRAK